MYGCLIIILCIDFRAAASTDESHLPTEPGKTGVQLSSESTDILVAYQNFQGCFTENLWASLSLMLSTGNSCLFVTFSLSGLNVV